MHQCQMSCGKGAGQGILNGALRNDPARVIKRKGREDRKGLAGGRTSPCSHWMKSACPSAFAGGDHELESVLGWLLRFDVAHQSEYDERGLDFSSVLCCSGRSGWRGGADFVFSFGWFSGGATLGGRAG